MKTVLITGGTGGIGTALTKAFCDSGYLSFVTHNHKSAEFLEQWLVENNLDKKNVEFVCIDLTERNEVESQIEALLKKSHVDVLINNAGITQDSSFLKMSFDKWQKVISTNLLSLFSITQPIAKSMVNVGSGKIINISSINGLKGQFGQTNYAAAKAGIIGFTKSLAQELAKKGVTVNAIAPGYTLTPMVEAMREDILESIKNNIPTKELVATEELAKTALFIANSGISLTGETISVNGGQYMS